MAFTTDEMALVYHALLYMEDGMSQHASWLKDSEGATIPGSELIIEQIELERKKVKSLVLSAYKNCFSNPK